MTLRITVTEHQCSAFCKPDQKIHIHTCRSRFPTTLEQYEKDVRSQVDPEARILDFRQSSEIDPIDPFYQREDPFPYCYVLQVQWVNHDPVEGFE